MHCLYDRLHLLFGMRHSSMLVLSLRWGERWMGYLEQGRFPSHRTCHGLLVIKDGKS